MEAPHVSFEQTLCDWLWDTRQSPFVTLSKLVFIVAQYIWKSEFCNKMKLVVLKFNKPVKGFMEGLKEPIYNHM